MTNKPVIIDHHPGPLVANHRDCARARHRPGPDPRAVGRRGRHQGRQPVLHGRDGEGRRDPRQPQEPHRQGRGPAQAAPRAARIHDRHVGRHPQRHARDALLADRPRDHQRCAVRAPERHGLAGTIAVVACDKPPVGTLAALLEHNQPSIIMSDGPIHPGTDPKTGEKLDIVSAYQVAGHPGSRAPPAHRLPCLPRLRQLRRHVHLQHDADVHRRRRHAAAAHGGAAVRRSAPGRRNSRTSWSATSRR